MTERLIAGWGVRLVDQPCGCDGRGVRPDNKVCGCAAGRRLREQGQQGERMVLAGGILPEPDGKVFGPGPDIDTTTVYR